jgi:hypothetical protein
VVSVPTKRLGVGGHSRIAPTSRPRQTICRHDQSKQTKLWGPLDELARTATFVNTTLTRVFEIHVWPISKAEEEEEEVIREKFGVKYIMNC